MSIYKFVHNFMNGSMDYKFLFILPVIVQGLFSLLKGKGEMLCLLRHEVLWL